MQSSLISDPRLARAVRAVADPYAAGIALLAALATGAVQRSLAAGVLAGLAVIAVRVAAEFVVPRGARLEVADAVAERERKVNAALASAEAMVRGRAPAAVETRVSSISGVVRDIMGRQSALGGASPQLFSVLRTATDYMPSALEAYMKLPPSYAMTRRQADGRTALEILTSQLDLLQKEMIDVADAVNKNDLDSLLAHERFLTQRFGRSALSLPDPE